MLKLFRVVSLIEGMSYLLILCVSLGFISRDFVSTLGMAHGALFVVYVALSMLASRKQGCLCLSGSYCFCQLLCLLPLCLWKGF